MGSSAADQTRLEEIEAKVLDLQRSIGIPRAEEKLKKRLNSRYYPVLTLPNELVSEIFLHFLPEYPRCPPLWGRLSPMTLTQICRQWREIAISTPRLWRAISFNPHLDRKNTLTLFADSMQHSDITLVRLESLVLNHFAVDDDPAEDYILSFIVPALRRLQIPEKHLSSDPID
ncbi:hypothetical protein B0H16DRAFT_1739040 [Mycena metata]|uniref:F-box domain-containing protein n=1 Tax=Mycena metata TaxID=1033252 RepID=A0AAD7MJ62_9AGAR|nr:hypothetical protein B0H16DRAFT_1739040 [Mycena metata]